MSLSRLKISQLRNLQEEELELSPHLNVIFGRNGSGKTSLLEAIHILALGKSFRTRDIGNVVREGAAELTVFGNISANGEGEVPVGIRKGKSATEIRISGEKVQRVSTLAMYLPVLLITPASHRLIESERQYRREFLDWGAFHVEQNFYAEWKTYKTALAQRNAALKSNVSERLCRAWDAGLVTAANAIDRARKDYAAEIAPYVANYAKDLLGVGDLAIRYEQGWPGKGSFNDALDAAWENDVRRGRTGYGPHRSDFRIQIEGADILHKVSRGQQKLLVYALKLAQIRHLRERAGKNSVMLLDDLTAELDGMHRDGLLELLSKESAQVLITTTDPELLNLHNRQGVKMFHVERGRVKEVAS